MSREQIHSVEEWEAKRAELIDYRLEFWRLAKQPKDPVELYEQIDQQMEECYVLVHPPQATPKEARAATTPGGGAKGKSSYQKVRDAMPPTALRLYDHGRKLVKINPQDNGTFDLSARDAGEAVGRDATTAADYIRLHLRAGVWEVEAGASLRGRRAASYRLVPIGEIDPVAAEGVYRDYRNAMRSRTAQLKGDRT
jgi:hypothetical protein